MHNVILLGYVKKNVENYSEKNYYRLRRFRLAALSTYLWLIDFRPVVVYRGAANDIVNIVKSRYL